MLLPTKLSVVSKIFSNVLIKETGERRSVVQCALVATQITQKSIEFLHLTGYTATSRTKMVKYFGATPALPPVSGELYVIFGGGMRYEANKGMPLML